MQIGYHLFPVHYLCRGFPSRCSGVIQIVLDQSEYFLEAGQFSPSSIPGGR